ncbi:MAG: NF038129 family PEP-CTERM protein [Candidatus Rokubacteria bacterium]|nr:NF038129 family PEP-CTERM protein [Candidatus Rokubacteria bacterium]
MVSFRSRRGWVWAVAALGAAMTAACPSPSGAVPVKVTIDTSALAGSGLLAFDLFGLDAEAGNNTVRIQDFSPPAAVIGPTLTTGDVTGQLPGEVRLGDGQFFAEALQEVALGDALAFTLEVSGSFAGSPGDPNDVVAIFLLDPADSFSLVDTDLVQDALLQIDIRGAQGLFVQVPALSQPNVPVTAAIPGPGALALAAVGLGLVLGRRVAVSRTALPRSARSES